MRFAHYKLLRRTAILIGAASALALALPAAAQGTATLVGASGTTCTYSQMTVQPNGNISITCNTINPTGATFSFTGATTLATGASGSYAITRTGGSEATIPVNWNATGPCTVTVGTASLAAGASFPFTVTAGATAGTCILSATPASGTASGLVVTVTGGGGGPIAGCPTPQAGYKPMTLGWSSTALELRMDSGVIASFPIPAPISYKASVKMTQGQQQMSPGDGISEMSISKCPGVIDTSNPSCYSSTSNGNNYTVSKDAYTRAVYSFNSQAALTGRGCWAPASEGQWYVNVRWTYANSCFGLACGYSMQWMSGAY
jgi:hypothetical protein